MIGFPVTLTHHAWILLEEDSFCAVNSVVEPSLKRQRPGLSRCAEGKGLEIGPESMYIRNLPFICERLKKSKLLRFLGLS